MAGAALFHTMEGVNLICGDSGNANQPGHSTHLEIQEMKLPGFEENYVEHRPGGSEFAIEIPTHMNRLEATFTLAGIQPEVMKLIGLSLRELQKFTCYGLVREQMTGRPYEAQATIFGRMGRVNPTAFRRGDLMAMEYSIRSIVRYELHVALNTNPLGGTASALTEIYYFDFFESAWRVYEENINKDINRILHIPSVAE